MDMIYILYGKDKSMVSMKLEAIKKRHHIQENVNIYDAQADEISNVLQDLDAYSIFDDDKMIIVNNCTFLSSKNTTNYEVDPFLVRKDTDMILVLVCPSDKLDTRKKKVKEIFLSQKEANAPLLLTGAREEDIIQAQTIKQ